MSDEMDARRSPEIELVRRLRPETLEPSAELLARERAALVGLVRAERQARVRRRRVVVSGLVATSVACVVLARDVRTTEPAVQVTCPDGSALRAGDDPVAACVTHWREQKEGTAPPPLVAYGDGKGGVAVLPAAEAPRPELRPLDPEPKPEPAVDPGVVDELDAVLADRLDGLYARCHSTTDARVFAQSHVARLALGNWSVEVDGEAADGKKHCAVAHVDVTRRRVVLSPVPAGRPSASGGQAPLFQLVRRLRASFVGDGSAPCRSLADAVSEVRAQATALDIVETDKEFVLREVVDNDAQCARVLVPARSRIEVIVRGPRAPA